MNPRRALPLLAFLAGCQEVVLIGDLYEPRRLLEVEIELDPADWDEIRFQTRSFLDLLAGEQCLAEPFPDPFTYVPADVKVEGLRRRNVGLRKKGLIGSMDTRKPSLKIDFGEFE